MGRLACGPRENLSGFYLAFKPGRGVMAKIETIFTHGGFELGIDENSNLYWNKKKVITEQTIKLEFWVNMAIIFASASTIVLAAFAVLDFIFCNGVN